MSIDSVDTKTVTIAGKGTVSPGALAHGLTAVLAHTTAKALGLPALSAVKIESSDDGKTLTMVATNRYTLGTFRIDWDGGAVNALLDADDAKALAAFAKKAGRVERIALTFTETTAEAFDFERRAGFRLVTDHEFVSWRGLIPEAGNGGDRIDRLGYNPALMALFAKAALKNQTMVLTFPATATKPTRVDIGDAFTGLIMPVRIPE